MPAPSTEAGPARTGLRAHLRYLGYVLRHKWFVLRAGLRVGAPLWRLLIHDWSKFTPAEWRPYVLSFYGPWSYKERPPEVVAAFDRAWLHHQHANPHHWQHWLLMEDAPAGPHLSYHPTSMDGGMGHMAFSEYARENPCGDIVSEVRIDLLGVADFDEGSGPRYAMLVRACDAANARRPRALPMPEPLVREMVADWLGAGRAITGQWDASGWYAKNAAKLVLHDDTRALVERLLAEHGRGYD